MLRVEAVRPVKGAKNASYSVLDRFVVISFPVTFSFATCQVEIFIESQLTIFIGVKKTSEKKHTNIFDRIFLKKWASKDFIEIL